MRYSKPEPSPDDRNSLMRLLFILLLVAAGILIAFLPAAVHATPNSISTTRPTNASNNTPTYAHDVAPILFDNCVTCHHAGEAGPFPLMTYDDARKRAKLIATVTQSHQMPPWKAESGYGHFMNERRLTDTQIATLAAWSDAKTPQGDPADMPPIPTFSMGGWLLGEPDLVVKMAEPFTVPADGRDVFRCFIVPLNLPHDEFVTAVEFRPSDRKVVHHALLFLDARGQADDVQKQWTAAHPEDKQIGYTRFGGPGFTPSGGLGGWAPGATPSFLPDGIARYVAGNSQLVIQTHFHPTGKPEVEQSTVALYFAKQPPKKVLSQMLLGNKHIDIPAGDKNYTVTDSVDIPCDLSVVGITPHAHLICKHMEVWATLPQPSAAATTQSSAQSESPIIPLIKIGDWDFNWQGQYRYAEPLHLPVGATLHMRYTYDNSADNERNPNDPPAEIRFGEQTTNEMAFCFLEVVPDQASDQPMLRRARIKHLLSMR